MTGCAVLLRGINVGGRSMLPMAVFRRILENRGYAQVRTYLQSGNAVLAAAEPPAAVERRVEDAIAAERDLAVRCLARTAAELAGVIAANPLPAGVGSRLLAVFLSGRPDPELLARHDPAGLAPAHIRLGDRVIYQWCPDGVQAAPPVGPFAEKYLAVTATARNWNTVTRLDAMLAAMPGAP